MPAVFIRSFNTESDACEAAAGLVSAGIAFRYQQIGEDEHEFCVDSDNRDDAREIFNEISDFPIDSD